MFVNLGVTDGQAHRSGGNALGGHARGSSSETNFCFLSLNAADLVWRAEWGFGCSSVALAQLHLREDAGVGPLPRCASLSVCLCLSFFLSALQLWGFTRLSCQTDTLSHQSWQPGIFHTAFQKHLESHCTREGFIQQREPQEETLLTFSSHNVTPCQVLGRQTLHLDLDLGNRNRMLNNFIQRIRLVSRVGTRLDAADHLKPQEEVSSSCLWTGGGSWSSWTEPEQAGPRHRNGICNLHANYCSNASPSKNTSALSKPSSSEKSLVPS